MTWLTWVTARPDGVRIAIGDGEGRVLVWSPIEGRIVARQRLSGRIMRIAWTRDGERMLAVAENDDAVHVFDGGGERAIGSFATGHENVLGLAPHPSRPLVTTAGRDAHVRVWDLAGGLPRKALHDFEEPSSGRCAAMSERLAAVGSSDGSFAAWDIETGKAFLGAKMFGSYVAAMAFTPDGKSLVLAGGKGGILENCFADGWKGGMAWEKRPPKPIATNAIEFAPNGSFVCAYSDDRAALFGSTKDEHPEDLGSAFWLGRDKPWEQKYIVSGACFVPGTGVILSSHFDGTLRVWKKDGLLFKRARVRFDDGDVPRFELPAPVPDAAAWWAELTGVARPEKRETKPEEAKKPRPGTQLLRAADAGARNLAEMWLAASLRPCVRCGAHAGELALHRGDGRCTFAGTCRFCGTKRTDTFFGDLDAAWPSHELGDARSSALVTPDALLAELARVSPATLAGKPPELPLAGGASYARARDRALVCLLELLKRDGPLARADGEPVTREQLAAERDRVLALGSDDRAPAPAQPAVTELLAAPQTIGALETALGIRFTWSHVMSAALGRIGKLDLPEPGTPPLGPRVDRLTATYGFDIHHEHPIEELDDLRRRTLLAWSATLVRGSAALDEALRAKHGEPREVDEKRVYGTWVVAKDAADDGCTLSWYAKLPDWAVPKPDAAARDAALRALAAACASAADLRAVPLPKVAGLEASVWETAILVELVPAIAASELARTFGWERPVLQAFAMHLDDWHLRVVTGDKPYWVSKDVHENGPDAALPSFGAWKVRAELAGFAKGPYVSKHGSLGGTRAVAPEDVVKRIVVGATR